MPSWLCTMPARQQGSRSRAQSQQAMWGTVGMQALHKRQTTGGGIMLSTAPPRSLPLEWTGSCRSQKACCRGTMNLSGLTGVTGISNGSMPALCTMHSLLLKNSLPLGDNCWEHKTEAEAL